MSESTYRLANLREQSDRFIMLSGCSGGGKSTLLTALERRGFTVFEEPGRQIVKEQQFLEGNALPWTNPLQFVELSVSRSIHQMMVAARLNQQSFFDRGIVDAISFLEHLSLPIPLYLENAVKQLRYHRRAFSSPRPGRKSLRPMPSAGIVSMKPKPSIRLSSAPMKALGTTWLSFQKSMSNPGWNSSLCSWRLLARSLVLFTRP
jgi:predicted ATPase